MLLILGTCKGVEKTTRWTLQLGNSSTQSHHLLGTIYAMEVWLSAVTRQGEVSRQGKHHPSVLGSQPLWVKDGVSFGSTSFIHENQELGLEMYSQLIDYLPACMRLWVQTPATHKPSVVSHDCTWFPSTGEAEVGGSEFQCHSQLHGNLGASLSYVRFYLRTKTVKNWKHPVCIPGIIKRTHSTPLKWNCCQQ